MRGSSNSSAKKRQSRDKRPRRQGMRLIEIWVPDVSSPEFAREARRQSRAVARSEREKDDLDFVDSISVWDLE